MKNRIELLNDLIHLQSDIAAIKKELAKYPWDAETGLIVLTKSDFITIASKYLNGELGADELEKWAEAIECREDIDFEINSIQESIFELANPIISGEIDKQRVQEMIFALVNP